MLANVSASELFIPYAYLGGFPGSTPPNEFATIRSYYVIHTASVTV